MPSGAGEPGLEFVTRGTYQREKGAVTSCTFTDGTEIELPLLATHIVCTEDALLSWIRLHFACYSVDEPYAYDWFLIKCQSTDATQDLSSNLVVESLQREKRIIRRGLELGPVNGRATSAPKVNKIELYQVELVRGEELRLIIQPYISGTASHGRYFEELEWRQVGV